MLLAIDTSAGTSVAVVDRDRGVIVDYAEPDTRSHAEMIGTLIDRALRESRVSVSSLSGVAIGMGPGPFTGLRVGIAAAKAFAFGAGIPLVRVVSHDAVAYQRSPKTPLLVVTDARRKEVYWSTYSGVDSHGVPVRVGEPGLCSPFELPDAVAGYAAYTRFDAVQVSAASAGLLAETLFEHGQPFAGKEPLYLRAPDATVSTGIKRVSS